MNASPGIVADVTDDDVFAFDSREFRIVDLVLILRYPVSREHERIACGLLRRRIVCVQHSQRSWQQSGQQGKGVCHVIVVP